MIIRKEHSKYTTKLKSYPSTYHHKNSFEDYLVVFSKQELETIRKGEALYEVDDIEAPFKVGKLNALLFSLKEEGFECLATKWYKKGKAIGWRIQREFKNYDTLVIDENSYTLRHKYKDIRIECTSNTYKRGTKEKLEDKLYYSVFDALKISLKYPNKKEKVDLQKRWGFKEENIMCEVKRDKAKEICPKIDKEPNESNLLLIQEDGSYSLIDGFNSIQYYLVNAKLYKDDRIEKDDLYVYHEMNKLDEYRKEVNKILKWKESL